MNTIKITIEVSPETAMKVISLIANEDGGAAMKAVSLITNETMGAPQTPPVQQFSAPVQTAPQTFAPAPVQQFTAPVQTAPAPAPVQQFTAPVQTAPAPAPVIPSNAPTSAPMYSIAQLQTACGPLADSGKLPELQKLIASFGVNSLVELPQARYGEFANGLRALGGVL